MKFKYQFKVLVNSVMCKVDAKYLTNNTLHGVKKSGIFFTMFFTLPLHPCP